MKESMKAKQLRLWKIRQIEKGHDVSNVSTLKEAEHFFDKQEVTVKENGPVKKPVKKHSKPDKKVK